MKWKERESCGGSTRGREGGGGRGRNLRQDKARGCEREKQRTCSTESVLELNDETMFLGTTSAAHHIKAPGAQPELAAMALGDVKHVPQVG